MIDAVIYASLPVILSGGGWIVAKVVQHDTWLKDMRTAIARIEDKLDSLLNR